MAERSPAQIASSPRSRPIQRLRRSYERPPQDAGTDPTINPLTAGRQAALEHLSARPEPRTGAGACTSALARATATGRARATGPTGSSSRPPGSRPACSPSTAHRGRMVRACPRTELGCLAHTQYLQPAEDLPVRSITCFHLWRRHRRHGVIGALIEAAIAATALSGPGRGGIPVDTAMPAHSRTPFPAWRQPSPGTVSASRPSASQPPGGTPQLTPPRPAPDPGRCRPMWRCDGHWQRHHAESTHPPPG
jgi:hypothetical protein